MLVIVLWMSSILSAVAISVAVAARSHALYERNAMSDVLAKGIADGLVRLAALRATSQDGGNLLSGEWRACRWFDDADAWIAAQDQSGLVDLNTASPALITALLEGLGLTPTEAAITAGELRDFRDADATALTGGTEPSVYPGRDFGPKNAPFEAVEELSQIPGLTSTLQERLQSLVTVSNGQSGIDLKTAPAGLLQVLGVDRSSTKGLSFSSPRMSSVIGITVAVQLKDSSRFVRRAFVERTGQVERPFAFAGWDEGSWPSGLPSQSLLDCRGWGLGAK